MALSTTDAVDQQLVLLNEELKTEKYKLLIEKWNVRWPGWPCTKISPKDFNKMDDEFDSQLTYLVDFTKRCCEEYHVFVEFKQEEGLCDQFEIERLDNEKNKANYDLYEKIFEQLGVNICAKIWHQVNIMDIIQRFENKQKRKRTEDVTARRVRRSPRLQATYRRTSARLAAKGASKKTT